MDYAKFAYLKATELEGYTNVNTSNKLSAANALEFVEPILNTYVAATSDLTCGKVHLYGSTIFQDKLMVKSTIAGKLSLEILVNGVSVLAEERDITIGENQIILLKAYEPPKECDATITLRLKATQNFACTITSNTMAIWGLVKEEGSSTSVEMRTFIYNNTLWLSYIENQKIMLSELTLESKSLLPSEFDEVASGVSHCFAQDKSGEVYLFRVDASGNLFYKPFNKTVSETKIDEGVSVCFARLCPNTCAEDILICYIKDGRPCYKCMTSGTVSSRQMLDVPAGLYVNISIANTNLNRMFVICTSSNLSNYILYSTEDGDLSKFVCSLNASAFMVVKRYTDIGNYQNLCPALSASMLYSIDTSYLNYQQLFNSKIAEHLICGTKIYTSPYQIEKTPTYNYILFCDQLVPKNEREEGEYRIKYLGDCEGWTPAYLKLYGDGSIVDESNILGKWPFNEIKPCIMKDGEVVGYLDPTNYKKYIDGTDAPTTNPDYLTMVEFPKIYYKFTMDWDGNTRMETCTRSTFTVNISNKPKEGYVCASHVKAGVEYDKIYISAYKAQINDGKILCYSGFMCNSTIEHRDILEYLSTAFEGQYTTLGINVTTLFGILQMLLFANLDSFETIGLSTYMRTDEKLVPNGSADTLGMYYGVMSLVDKNLSIKTFGLENLTGSAKTMHDGFYTDSSYNMYVYNPYKPNCELKYTTDNYKSYNFDFELVRNMCMGYIAMYYVDNECGLLPMCVSRSSTAYNLSLASMVTTDRYLHADKDNYPVMDYMYGNDYEYDNANGLVGFSANYTHNPGNTIMGERLIYYPKSLISN